MELLRDEMFREIEPYVTRSSDARKLADAILSIPTIKEALAFHESCKSAFKVNGEFAVTEANVVGKGGVSAS